MKVAHSQLNIYRFQMVIFHSELLYSLVYQRVNHQQSSDATICPAKDILPSPELGSAGLKAVLRLQALKTSMTPRVPTKVCTE